MHKSKVHRFKEFNKYCISQVFSDTIQIVKYYTAKVCLAQGVTVHTSHKLLVFDQPNVFLILMIES